MSYDFTQTKSSLESAKKRLRDEYKQISTGRANPSLLDMVLVESYGTKQPVKNMASINLEDARTLRVVPWDKDQISAIETAVKDSKLPFSISIDDAGLRISVPQLTEESKKEIVKLAKEKLESARIQVRDIRHKAKEEIEAMEGKGDISENEKENLKLDLQKLIDKTNKEIEETFANKEKDIMNI